MTLPPKAISYQFGFRFRQRRRDSSYYRGFFTGIVHPLSRDQDLRQKIIDCERYRHATKLGLVVDCLDEERLHPPGW